MNQALPSYPWQPDDQSKPSGSSAGHLPHAKKSVRIAPFTAIPTSIVFLADEDEADANSGEAALKATLLEAYPRLQVARTTLAQFLADPSAYGETLPDAVIVSGQKLPGNASLSQLAQLLPPASLIILSDGEHVAEWKPVRASETKRSDKSEPMSTAAESMPESVLTLLERREQLESKRRLRTVRFHAMRRENERLRRICSEDPLTGLLNRRGFFKLLEMEFASAARSSEEIACVFIDVDYFKRLNDNYGHKAGDQALKLLAKVLRRCSRVSDIVGRIGGEEFCVALPSCNEFQAFRWAEKARTTIATTPFRIDGRNLYLTASFGVASCPAHRFEEFDLVDQADRALLAAKNSGRNRVVRAETMSQDRSLPESAATNHAVRSLLAALTIRDPATAHHSHRCAQFAVHCARHLGMMDNEIWIVEAAALLHDIGKLGLPDSILHKPESLSGDDRLQLEHSQQGGLDMVRAAFGEGPLVQTLAASRVWFEKRTNLDHYPLSGRIVAIADAFDAMTTPRPYRSIRDASQALEELRRAAGIQFDPELVQAFIASLGHTS